MLRPAPHRPVGTRPTRLRQVDAMRVLTCVCVVAVHVVANTNRPGSAAAGGVAVLLHHSREVFFFVTSLVLVHRYRSHPPAPGPFGRHRLAVIGIPYLLWTLVYLLAAGESPLRLPFALAAGTGWYHLYFLLACLQFSLVFPWFLRLLRAMDGRYGRLLAVSFVLQLATLVMYQRFWMPVDLDRVWAGESSLPAYQFWLVAGGVAAMRLERFDALVRRHARLIVALVVVAAVVAEAAYWAALRAGAGPDGAAQTLQPVTVVWAVPALLGTYLLASACPAVLDPLVRHGARLSFGVYLTHPLLLRVFWRYLRLLAAPAAARTAIAFVATLAAATALAALANRTPLSLPLIGRSRYRRQAMPRVPTTSRPGPRSVTLGL